MAKISKAKTSNFQNILSRHFFARQRFASD
jgi:hypothetical protein